MTEQQRIALCREESLIRWRKWAIEQAIEAGAEPQDVSGYADEYLTFVQICEFPEAECVQP